MAAAMCFTPGMPLNRWSASPWDKRVTALVPAAVKATRRIKARGGYRRIEILTGPGRWRRQSVEDKAWIVAKTLVKGECG